MISTDSATHGGGVESITQLRANDVVSLSFYDGYFQSDKKFNPHFTHQVFEEEAIPLSSTDKVIIQINFQPDLTSTVELVVSNEDDEAYIRHKLAKFAPTPDLRNISFDPIGTRLNSFTIENDEFDFFLASHTDAGASELLARAEKIAVWFIETADSIDFNDDRWEVLWIYANHVHPITGVKSSFIAGYMTLFIFHNPFAGSKIRVCQVLILPPYQGRGLGRRALLEVYALAASRDAITEVTVEDPCEGFQRLRDAVDLEWSLLQPQVKDYASNAYAPKDSAYEDTLHPPDVVTVARSLKLVPSQVQFVLDCITYRHLKQMQEQEQEQELVVGKKRQLSDEDVQNKSWVATGMKKFRLGIKKQILKANGDLRGLKKSDMQRELDVLYKEEQARLDACFQKEYLWLHVHGAFQQPCASDV